MMDNGYVYVLSNATMPGLVKIGKTTRSSEERARELSRSSAVPTRFLVEYEVFSPAASELERAVHAKLESCRHSANREFFAAEPLQVVPIIRSIAEEMRLKYASFASGENESFERYEAIDILGRLRTMYGSMIRPEIASARIYQTRLRCYLEAVEQQAFPAYEPTPLLNQTITRSDLGFISGAEFAVPMFHHRNPVSENARLFLEGLDSYSKLVCCSELFTDEGSDLIQDEYFSAQASDAQRSTS